VRDVGVSERVKGEALAVKPAIGDPGLLCGQAARAGDLPIKLMHHCPREHVQIRGETITLASFERSTIGALIGTVRSRSVLLA
jgi:hypothetical protein